MTDTPGDLPNANEADALEQAQAVDGALDDSSEELGTDDDLPPEAARWDADEADVIEQARTVKPARDEEYPDTDEA
jgi:hypothetical protein